MHILFLFVFMYITQGKCSIAFPFVSLKRVIFFFNFLMFSCHNDYCLLLLLMQNSNCFENVCDWFCGNIVNFRLRKKKKENTHAPPPKKHRGAFVLVWNSNNYFSATPLLLCLLNTFSSIISKIIHHTLCMQLCAATIFFSLLLSRQNCVSKCLKIFMYVYI